MKGLSANTAKINILHVEDDPNLASAIRITLECLGFKGTIILAETIAKAREILSARSRQKDPLDLILVDMQLPDGLGLDIIREVKDNPIWHRTPVIVLSNVTDPKIINRAYALGANCFLPKQGRGQGVMKGLQALYSCWIEHAYLPDLVFASKVEESLTRTIQVRAKAARFYHNLAKASSNDQELEKFWIERSLMEGNKSNLLAFYQEQFSDNEIAPRVLDRNLEMQQKISEALNRVEGYLAAKPRPAASEVCRWVIEVLEAMDEDVLDEDFEALFPKNPAVTATLAAYSARQIRILAEHILKYSEDQQVKLRAHAQHAFAERLSQRLQGESTVM